MSTTCRVRRTLGLLLWVLTFSVCLRGDTERPATRTEYLAALDRLIAAAQDPAARPESFRTLADRVPVSWTVQAGSESFEIPSWIARDVRALENDDKKGTGKRALLVRLQDLRQQLHAYEAQPLDASQSRRRLQQILARREFADLKGPGWLERMRERLLGWLIEHLPSFLGSSRFSTVGKGIVYLLAGVALLLLVLVVVRNLRTVHRQMSVVPDATVISAKPWDSWLADARLASERGAWQDAVRLAYWTAISFLESRGLWPPDRARTPREYLRLLSADHQYHPALTRLTRLFESAWYARAGADADTFAGAIHLLEELGCGSR